MIEISLELDYKRKGHLHILRGQSIDTGYDLKYRKFEYRYNGFVDVVQKTYAREGLRGFYKGLSISLMKVVPSMSVRDSLLQFQLDSKLDAHRSLGPVMKFQNVSCSIKMKIAERDYQQSIQNAVSTLKWKKLRCVKGNDD